MTPEQLRDTLGRLSLTQVGAAKAIGVHQTTMFRWCDGSAKVPRPVEALLMLMERDDTLVDTLREWNKGRDTRERDVGGSRKD